MLQSYLKSAVFQRLPLADYEALPVLPRDWFSVGLRLFGVYVFYRGVSYLLATLADKLELLSRTQISRDLEMYQAHNGYYLMMAIGFMGFGFLLIYGAEGVTRWKFNESSPYSSPKLTMRRASRNESAYRAANQIRRSTN
jgi:hypothetical protein